MATNAFITTLNGFAAKPMIHMQIDTIFNEKKNLSCRRWFTSLSQPMSKRRHQSSVNKHGRKLLPLKAVSGNEHFDEEDNQQLDHSRNEGKEDQLRQSLEYIIGDDSDARFDGKELATLIRNKYGRSYDVQLIKKEFMGRQLLAMNVMWKFREQRSFPLTEEEYLLHLDDVANNLKCWGAVSYVRNSLAKTRERPRIGKAVSIFIDLDETGGRANEWIYR